MRQKKTSDATEPKLPVVSDSSGDERDNSALDAARQNQSSITSEQILTRFDLFLEAASEGIYDWSVETDELWVSQRFSEIFSLEAPAITPKGWLDTIHVGDLGPYRDAIRNHFKSRDDRLDVEYRVRSKEGGYRWLLDRSLSVRRDDGRVLRLVGAVLDVTALKEREAEFARSSMVLETTLEYMDQGITLIDESFNVIAHNKRLLELLELPAEMFSGSLPLAEALRYNAERGEYGSGDIDEFVAERLALAEKFEPFQFERTRPNGTVLEIIGRPLPEKRGFVTTCSDITRRKKAEQKLYAQATTDELTGLYNRRHFLELSRKELNKAIRHHLPYSVMFIDIDKFKSVNDTYGHAVGDVVLREVAAVICKSVRDEDIASRFGGEEFAVMMPNTNVHQALVLAERLREAVEVMETRAEESPIRVTVSIGLSESDLEENSLNAAIGRADEALYRAKESGRNRVEVT